MLMLSSCPETQVPRDFGAGPLKLKTQEWAGTWGEPGSKDAMLFTITDADKGEITVEEKENTLRVVVREITGGEESKDLALLIHFDKKVQDFGSFHLIRRPEKGSFCLWGVKHDVVEAAVKSGELKGELEHVKKSDKDEAHNHVRLTADPANYAKLLDAKYWNWMEPEFFIRREVP